MLYPPELRARPPHRLYLAEKSLVREGGQFAVQFVLPVHVALSLQIFDQA